MTLYRVDEKLFSASQKIGEQIEHMSVFWRLPKSQFHA